MSLFLILSIVINIVIIFSTILGERREPEKTLMWIFILIIFGPIGFLFYVFLGKDVRRTSLKNVDLYNSESVNKLNLKIQKNFTFENNEEVIQITNLISKLTLYPICTNSEIKIFSNGIEKFKELKLQLINAKHHIHMEYFIVKDDEIGNEIKDILIKKAREGIKVKFIIDKIGSHKLSKDYINQLKSNGINVLFYSYISTPFLKLINTQINYRNHRKIVVIDGLISFTGGINIGDEYLGKSKLGYWRDTHLMIKGECSLAIQSVFINDYLNLTKNKNKNKNIFWGKEIKKYFPEITTQNETITQIIKSGANLPKESMILPIIKLLSLAKKSIKISTPYFIPFTGMLNILKAAIMSGVEVIINFPGKPDHKLVYYASRTYLYELFKIGCKIYFYDKNSFLHSKFIIIDDYIVTAGSTNMDIRSFELNHELNLIIYDKKIAMDFINQFNKDIENSSLAKINNFQNLSKGKILYENIARLFSSIL